MPTAVELAAGIFGIVLGIAWVIWPTRMRNIQMKYLYMGMSGDEENEQSDTEVLIGRITGAVLALLGVVLALGLLP